MNFHLHVLLFACLWVVGCDDAVTSDYETRQAAERDQLFQRGWLPEIIPSSSFEITTRNDLDLNLSEGEFTFDPSETKSFLSKLRRMAVKEVPEASLFRYLERDYWPYAYSEGTSEWVFYVHESQGHCEYTMSLNPGG